MNIILILLGKDLCRYILAFYSLGLQKKNDLQTYIILFLN
jgi:hypothetical protein